MFIRILHTKAVVQSVGTIKHIVSGAVCQVIALQRQTTQETVKRSSK